MSNDISKDVIDIEVWEAEALDEVNLIRNHQMIQTWCERIIILCAEVRDWKNVAKGYHDELEKIGEAFQYAVKSWKLNEEIDSDTIKDLKTAICIRDEVIGEAVDLLVNNLKRINEGINLGSIALETMDFLRKSQEIFSSSEALYDKPHKNEIYGKADKQVQTPEEMAEAIKEIFKPGLLWEKLKK